MAEKQAVMAGMMAANTDKRRESYRNLTNLLGEDEDSLDWSNYMGASDTGKVLKNLKADLTSQNEKEVLDALGVCMHLLASSSFLAGIDTSGQKSLYATLIKVLKTQRDKKIINIVLQSLARSRLTKEVYINDLDESFDVLREILQSKDLPPPVIVKVRKSALAVIGEVGETLDKMEDPSLRSNLMKTVLPDLKDKYCKDMVRMVLGGDISILQVWRETVGLLGTVLHSSRSLINCLLNVVEKAFKISDHECFDEAIQTMKFSDERQKSLGTLIFSFLLAHIRGITSADVQKKEVVDVVKELFSTLSHIESLCQPGDSQSHFLFKFFNLLTVGNLALPKKVLNSHQYHIPTTSSGDAQDIMCGTLSNHLIAQLCRPALLHHAVSGNE
ncbi:hypothetical protein E2C01_011218 [Portunus trituberculatus]|uniref:Uncharacterized protein n=1 Tax=Portunus trituberculatus TaxID=210409 RepID=A0A5B7DAU8_PORTR|nr:hypothetical protein [Portunus trituberculatus]